MSQTITKKSRKAGLSLGSLQHESQNAKVFLTMSWALIETGHWVYIWALFELIFWEFKYKHIYLEKINMCVYISNIFQPVLISAQKKRKPTWKLYISQTVPKKRSWCSKKDAFFHLSCRCPIRRSIVRSTGGKHSSSNAAGSALRKHLDEAPCKYLWPEVTLWWGLSTFTTQTYLKTICLHRLSPSKFHQNCKTKKIKFHMFFWNKVLSW